MKSHKACKLICFVLALIIMTISMPFATTVHAEPQPVRITRTVSTTSTDIGEKFTVSYDITGDKIQVKRPKKEIAVVIDCSWSMNSAVDGSSTSNNNKKRITIAKNAAKDFISYFNNTNTKIFVVPYGDYAGSNKAISDFRDMKNASSLNYLNNYIDSITLKVENTNTGDALRIAYYKLKNEGAPDAEKYIVLLTDGEPHGYTYKKVGSSNVYYTGTGMVDNNTIRVDTSDSHSNDTYKKGYEYAKNIGALIKPEANFSTFIIGFAQNDTSYSQYDKEKIPREVRMDEIGKSCGAAPVASNGGKHFYNALTEEDLTNAYNAIKNIISDTIPFSFMTFSDILPAGVDIDPQTRQYLIEEKNFVIQEITYEGENRLHISVPLDTVLRRIEAESTPEYDTYKIDDTNISFEIQVFANKSGNKRFEKHVTRIDYTYCRPDGTIISGTAFNDLEQDVEINLLNTTISMLPNNIVLLGSSKTLTAEVGNPEVNKVVEWTMDPADIITLSEPNQDEGSVKITGVKVGTATVTARTQSTNGWYNEATASCNVIVVDVSLDDMYILKGTADGIPIPLKIENESAVPVDVQLTAWSVDEEHENEEEPFIEIDMEGKKIKGLRSTGDNPVNLSLTVNVEGQQKTVDARVHVLDLDIPQPMDVQVFQKKEFETVYSVPDDTYRSRLAISGEYMDAGDAMYVEFDDSDNTKWTVNGISLKDQADTAVEIKVTVSFDDGTVVQTKEVTRIITVRKPYIDIN